MYIAMKPPSGISPCTLSSLVTDTKLISILERSYLLNHASSETKNILKNTVTKAVPKLNIKDKSPFTIFL
jgi:hypothetical protein